MKSFTVTLPWPKAELMPNRSHGTHWSKTSKKRADARKEAWATTLGPSKGFVCPNGEIPLKIVFHQPKRYKPRDWDGLVSSCKPAIDGIADALGINDNRFWPISIDRVFTDGLGHVVVTITEMQAEQPQQSLLEAT